MEYISEESHILQDLEERGQGAVCASQDGDDRVADVAPNLDRDVEIDDEGRILNCWWDEEGGVSIRHSNHSSEETLLGNVS